MRLLRIAVTFGFGGFCELFKINKNEWEPYLAGTMDVTTSEGYFLPRILLHTEQKGWLILLEKDPTDSSC